MASTLRSLDWLWAACALALLAGGCREGPKLVQADGTVTLDGRPVEGAAVAFYASAGGPLAAATTDAQGRFELKTINDLGAVPGEYKVSICKFRRNITMGGDPLPNMPLVTWSIPQKYLNSETSGLKATVATDKGRNHFQFPLSSK